MVADHARAIIDAQERRERLIQTVLATSATFLTLISASATGRTDPAHATQLLAAQFLLCLLFAGGLAYCLTSLNHQTLAIADHGARRMQLEQEHGLTPVESTVYDVKKWRGSAKLPGSLLAAIPRYGQSQRHAILLAPVVALLPASWFTLTGAIGNARSITVVVVAAVLGVLVVRLFFAGCRHWVWVDPRNCTLNGTQLSKPMPNWGWWFQRIGTRRTPISRAVWFVQKHVHGVDPPPAAAEVSSTPGSPNSPSP